MTLNNTAETRSAGPITLPLALAWEFCLWSLKCWCRSMYDCQIAKASQMVSVVGPSIIFSIFIFFKWRWAQQHHTVGSACAFNGLTKKEWRKNCARPIILRQGHTFKNSTIKAVVANIMSQRSRRTRWRDFNNIMSQRSRRTRWRDFNRLKQAGLWWFSLAKSPPRQKFPRI